MATGERGGGTAAAAGGGGAREEGRTGESIILYTGCIFGHFFGGFMVTDPHLDNVTDDYRYSQLLPDFPSVGVDIILTVRIIEKRSS